MDEQEKQEHIKVCEKCITMFNDFTHQLDGRYMIKNIMSYDYSFRDAVYKLKTTDRKIDIRYKLNVYNIDDDLTKEICRKVKLLEPVLELYGWVDANDVGCDKIWFKQQCRLNNKPGDYMLEKSIYIPHHMLIPSNALVNITTKSGFNLEPQCPDYELWTTSDLPHTDLSEDPRTSKFDCFVNEKYGGGLYSHISLGILHIKNINRNINRY